MSLVPSKKGGGRKKSEFKCCGLLGPHVKGCFSFSTACVWLAQPLRKWREGGVFKISFYKQMTRGRWEFDIQKWQHENKYTSERAAKK